ncbi:uncharacterized protein TRAVEDRAFT_43168 [Trametes versicolor FP-101664 SS1]|uniref:uncharacterized protein n=1 Tax=Trametes versicolor (strain FP-101664) TaxID=717944 RepID=UPI000462439E|nr:uncharacterized protein TRAVEDRAFT_43168 [Trametes versicolor FP-101664 SS1]EIW62845.1 hypothetical protein TRAVEDRAFT_43168 [Trametes versicolor FP-101664 SS1]
MSNRVREPSLKRTSSSQENRTSASWNRDPSNFSHLRGLNPTYDEHPDVDGNPLGHIRSTGPSTADPDSLIEDTSGAKTPTHDRATTPIPGEKTRSQDMNRSASTSQFHSAHI